jgi:RNA polymerase sigma factor (sigma-70 family)
VVKTARTGTRRTDVPALVAAAAAGHEWAWEGLFRRFDPVLRRVARGFRIPPHQVDDVLQATWLRVFRHIHRLDNPAAVGGWIVTTARRESLRALQRVTLEVPTDEPLGDVVADPDSQEDPDAADEDRSTAFKLALDSLPPRERAVLEMLARDPAPSYDEVASALGMPVGSIGPTRGRAVARLRRHPNIARAMTVFPLAARGSYQ